MCNHTTQLRSCSYLYITKKKRKYEILSISGKTKKLIKKIKNNHLRRIKEKSKVEKMPVYNNAYFRAIEYLNKQDLSEEFFQFTFYDSYQKFFKGGLNMVNLCKYCKKARNCSLLKEISNEISPVAEDFAVDYNVIIDFSITSCPEFVSNRQGREIEHICLSCAKANTCKLWNQVCNIDEDFIRAAFDYDPEHQNVCSTVSSCKFYKPVN